MGAVLAFPSTRTLRAKASRSWSVPVRKECAHSGRSATAWRRVLHRDNTLCIALKVRAGARLSCDPNFSEGDRGCLHRRLLAVGRSDRRDPFFKGLRFAPASDVATIADRSVARIDLGQSGGLRLRLASAALSCLDVRPLIKGYFSALRWSWVRSCLRPLTRRIGPLALMLSADPLPRSRERA